MYRVSAAALIVRLQQVGIIDQSTLAYAFQTFARAWRKAEPVPLEPNPASRVSTRFRDDLRGSATGR